MTQRRELTIFERGLHKGQHGASDISRILKIPRETCRDVIKRYCEEGLTEPTPRSGRPPLLTEHEERTLIRTVRGDRQESLQQLTAKFNDLSLTPISVNQ
ncbi:1688_t:CDS:1 [Ambispora leptoticha]|uniref:1688_t:CDS:1 n=1 Tax=Ambispora leptoticha TaxID=144679 RepID=A0A9N9CCW8_9GLOM|nr:1688_t:CDS:1 [Ambispora leptoticha]